MKSLLVRFRAAGITFALAAAGVLGVGAITAPEALAACSGTINFTNTYTIVKNDSQCYLVRASIKGYIPGIGIDELLGEMATNKSEIHLPSGSSYMRNGMGLKGSPSAGWSWSYYVY